LMPRSTSRAVVSMGPWSALRSAACVCAWCSTRTVPMGTRRLHARLIEWRCRVSVAGVGADGRPRQSCSSSTGRSPSAAANLLWRDAPRDPHLRLPPAGPPLAGTREWWVTAAQKRRLHRSADDAFEAHWTRRRRRGRLGRCAPTSHRRRWAFQCLRLLRSSSARHRAGSPWSSAGRRSGRPLGDLVSAARRRVLVTVPYARPRALPVREVLDLMAEASSRRVACALLLGAIPDPKDVDLLAALPFQVRRMDPERSTVGARQRGWWPTAPVLVSSAN